MSSSTPPRLVAHDVSRQARAVATRRSNTWVGQPVPGERVAWLIISAVIGSVIGKVALNGLGLPTPYLLVLAFCAAAAAIGYIALATGVRPLPLSLRHHPALPPRTGESEDGLRLAVRTWDNRLDYSRGDPAHLMHIVLPGFADIVDERLRLKYGIIRAAEPDRARAIIGDELWRFLAEPPARGITPQQIAAVVARMEDL